jgi:2-polyprenyl-3-methyl-5-hydroxy-6-metoxy-1,4-benzoquinol methylase
MENCVVKVLVAIANHGTKNAGYLERLLAAYRSMPYDVHVVVLSNIPKDLGPDVEVIVGLLAKDPWSLPFGHKRIFADRLDDYDLFIYSEDDTLVQQRHIEAFLEMTEVLPADRIAGFLRYEEDADGHRYCSSIHSFYRWAPSSVRSWGPHVFAYCTNEHAACYMLTRDQLKRAIDSGGFLVPPHKGRYDLLCTAATDPYTQCGLTKVICISRIEDFLLHHLPNQYLGRMGLPFDQMHAQIEVLLGCGRNGQECGELLRAPTGLKNIHWYKRYYEPAREEVLATVRKNARRILSIGCGDGTMEAALMERGAQVVGIPLDAVIAGSAKTRGVELTTPDLEVAMQSLRGRRFDCILMVDVLQRVQSPPALLRDCADLIADGGRIVIMVPNFRGLAYRRDCLDGRLLWRTPNPFERFNLHLATSRAVAAWIGDAGLRIREMRYDARSRAGWLGKLSCGVAGRYLSRRILITAEKAR